jgi:hypothetical protein
MVPQVLRLLGREEKGSGDTTPGNVFISGPKKENNDLQTELLKTSIPRDICNIFK